MNIKIMPLMAFFLISCADFSTKVRTPKVLTNTKTFLVSNSQTNPYQNQVKDKVLDLNYQFIIKNISEKNQYIDLANSFLMVGDKKYNLGCSFFESDEKQKSIKIDDSIGVVCKSKIKSNAQNKMAIRDTEIKLHVSVNLKQSLVFEYFTFIEDFE